MLSQDQAAELRRARADATHEATHAFDFVLKPVIDRRTGFPVRTGVAAWKWFDEATAMFMESQVNKDWLRFALDWVDRPNVPLDVSTEPAVYRAGLFARHLVRVMGDPAFLSRVWLAGPKDTDPFITLQRLLGARPFCSAQPGVVDVFASGFCMDSYFVWEQEAEVHGRFLERGVEYSWELANGKKRNRISSVHHLPQRLACLYFRFYLERGVREMQLTLGPVHRTGPPIPAWIKAEVALVTRNKRQRKGCWPLRPPSKGPRGRLSAQIPIANTGALDHLVLVISNCDLDGAGISGQNMADEFHLQAVVR